MEVVMCVVVLALPHVTPELIRFQVVQHPIKHFIVVPIQH